MPARTVMNEIQSAIAGQQDAGKVLAKVKALLEQANEESPVFVDAIQRVTSKEMQGKIRDYLIRARFGGPDYATHRLLTAYYARDKKKKKDAGMIRVPISKIRVGTRFRKELGDVQSLARSIAEVGLLQPIVVTEDLQLIAGQRRLEACKLLGWKDIPASVINIRQILLGEFYENTARKGFSPSEMIAIKNALDPMLEEEVKKAKSEGGKHHAKRYREEKTRKNLTTVPKEEKRVQVAKYLGVSHVTLHKAEKVVDAAKKEPGKFGPVLQQVDAGETSVDSAYKMVKQAQGQKKTPAPAEQVPVEFTRYALEHHDPIDLEDAKRLIRALREEWKQAENDRDVLREQVNQLRIDVARHQKTSENLEENSR